MLQLVQGSGVETLGVVPLFIPAYKCVPLGQTLRLSFLICEMGLLTFQDSCQGRKSAWSIGSVMEVLDISMNFLSNPTGKLPAASKFLSFNPFYAFLLHSTA